MILQGKTKDENTRGFHKIKKASPDASSLLQRTTVYSTSEPMVHEHMDSIVTTNSRHLMFSDHRELNTADAYN